MAGGGAFSQGEEMRGRWGRGEGNAGKAAPGENRGVSRCREVLPAQVCLPGRRKVGWVGGGARLRGPGSAQEEAGEE